jgi:hypothetical protein
VKQRQAETEGRQRVDKILQGSAAKQHGPGELVVDEIFPSLAHGTVVNGVAVSEIIAKLLTVTKADGNSTLEYRVNSLQLTRNEAETHALFDWHFPLFFPLQDEITPSKLLISPRKSRLSFKSWRCLKPQKDAGVAPDIYVKPIAENIGKSLDTELLAVKALIQKSGFRE